MIFIRIFFQNVEYMVKLTSFVSSHCVTLDGKVGMARNALAARKRNPVIEAKTDFNFA